MQGDGVKPILHTFALVMTFCLLLSACQSNPGQGEFYVYTDAQGNLVTIEKPLSEQAAEEAKEDSVETVDTIDTIDTSGGDLLSAPLEDYRPSEEIDQELAAKERDRFITYMDESGQLVSRPVDMVAEKEAKNRVEPDYAELSGGDGFLETYRTIRQDCCLHLLDESETLGAGQEILITFAPDSPVLLGDQPFKAKALKFAEDVNSLDLKAFIRKKDYVAAQLLWLDEQGRPLLLVDQPFSRKYPETWYRYGYLQGTFPRESGQRHLVVFLPYQQEQPSTDGLQAVLNGELLLSAQ
ncbi:hypothetical protein SAMN04515663_102310 [Alcanivorax sp. DSM 26293]|nr:hypothetical protein SAMN04515663_102310 [Alcanivorax sp. DSM 26293]